MKIAYTSGKQLEHYLPYQKSKLDEIRVLLIELWSPFAQTDLRPRYAVLRRFYKLKRVGKLRSPDRLSNSISLIYSTCPTSVTLNESRASCFQNKTRFGSGIVCERNPRPGPAHLCCAEAWSTKNGSSCDISGYWIFPLPAFHRFWRQWHKRFTSPLHYSNHDCSSRCTTSNEVLLTYTYF